MFCVCYLSERYTCRELVVANSNSNIEDRDWFWQWYSGHHCRRRPPRRYCHRTVVAVAVIVVVVQFRRNNIHEIALICVNIEHSFVFVFN